MGMKSDDTCEAGFMNAISLAGRAFVAAKGKDPTIEGAELAKRLLSDHPLSKGQRKLLAELVTGEWRRRAGRTQLTPSTPIVKDVVARLRELKEEGWPIEAAKKQVSSEFGVKRSTIDSYEKMTLEREAAVEDGKKKARLSRKSSK